MGQDKGEKPQYKVSSLNEKNKKDQTMGGGLRQYATFGGILAIIVLLAVIAFKLVQSPQAAAPTQVAAAATNTPPEAATIQALEATNAALLVTPSLDPNVVALQTQNAILIQSVTDQAGTSEARLSRPTDAPQPTQVQQVQVVTATSEPPIEKPTNTPFVRVVTATPLPTVMVQPTDVPPVVIPTQPPAQPVWTVGNFNSQTGTVTLGNANAWVVFQGWDGQRMSTMTHGVIEPGMTLIVPAPFLGTMWTVTNITHDAITARAIGMREEVMAQGGMPSKPPLLYIGTQAVPPEYISTLPTGWTKKGG